MAMPIIFWKTVVISAAILSVATILGRFLALALPLRIQGSARFYLAPSFGLAILIVVASLVGRHVAIGVSPLLLVVIFCLLAFSLFYETERKKAFAQALTVSLLGLVCGGVILERLMTHGAFNVHNDTFTYLAHSDWLQSHAFAVNIDQADVTPFTTQIYSYQASGLRMGASYLLALVQAATRQQWAYDVYPAVVISTITSCCLAAGFPIARYLRAIPRVIRYGLFAVPTFTVGGLMFGATTGFFPQIIGITLGASLLFLIGTVLRWAAIHALKTAELLKAAIPAAILFSALTFSYSEVMPLILIAMLASAALLAWRGKALGRISLYGFMVASLSLIVLNTELVRTINAVRFQSHALVGTPVDWALVGFIGHMFGVHGGAWDGLHWAATGNVGTTSYWIGLSVLLVVVAIALLPWRWIAIGTKSGELSPIIAISTLFFIGIVYFRYFVPSTFSVGKGASWSQFKLSDWAGPFIAVFLLLGLVKTRSYLGRIFVPAAATFVALCFAFTVVSPPKVLAGGFAPFINYYGSPRDLDDLYKDLRATVINTCPSNKPVFVALDGEDIKAREIVVLYLPDRVLHSDWTNDVYFDNTLPTNKKKQEIQKGDCVVEATAQPRFVSAGKVVGPFRVGQFDGSGLIVASSTTGAYGKESDGTEWWRWVPHKVEIDFSTNLISAAGSKTNISFDYQGIEKQILTMKVMFHGYPVQEFVLNSDKGAPLKFEKTFDVPPGNIEKVTIETNVQPTTLGTGDSRAAAWNLRNFVVTAAERE